MGGGWVGGWVRSSHSALCYSMVYIKTVKKRNRLIFFTWLRLVKKMRVSKIANLVNAPTRNT